MGIDATVEHHENAIGQADDLLEVGGNEEHGEARIAGGAELLPDRRLGATPVEALTSATAVGGLFMAGVAAISRFKGSEIFSRKTRTSRS